MWERSSYESLVTFDSDPRQIVSSLTTLDSLALSSVFISLLSIENWKIDNCLLCTQFTNIITRVLSSSSVFKEFSRLAWDMYFLIYLFTLTYIFPLINFCRRSFNLHMKFLSLNIIGSCVIYQFSPEVMINIEKKSWKKKLHKICLDFPWENIFFLFFWATRDGNKSQTY